MNTEIVQIPDTTWMEDRVQSVEHSNWLYKLCCFFLGRKKTNLTYKELFLVIYGINRRKMGDKEAKTYAMNEILKTYKFHNNKLPNGIEENEQ